MNEDRFERDHGAMLEALKQARGDCPPADRLLDWVEGSLDGKAAVAVETHVLLCSRCAEAAERAADPKAGIDELSWRRAARGLARREAPWRTGWQRIRPAWLATAAAAVAVLAIFAIYWPDPEQGLPPAVTTVRDADIELIEPVGAIPELAAFRWRGIPAPVRYRIELTESGPGPEPAETLWSEITADTRALPDSSLEARLAPGRSYRWRVVVLDAEGQELSRSAWAAFELGG